VELLYNSLIVKAGVALATGLIGSAILIAVDPIVGGIGTSLTPRSIERSVAKFCRAAGVSKTSVHTLRHTFATHMVRKGTNLRVVQEALGHSSLQTTSRYVSLARELMDEQLEANAL
jgi:site-specific recombinase XerD